MTLIDGDRIVTAQLYDDEHEEFTEKKMSIIDYVNTYTDEGVTTDDDVLDKIRAEIKGMTPTYHNPDWTITDLVPISEVLKLVDKYKAETEET